ncbi:histidine acid phosphatase [Trichuris suis]|nr:histidine acid phosphatase [Trichuris suis]
MEFTRRIIFLLLAVSHVSSDIEGNKTIRSKNISPTKFDALHYLKLKLQTLFTMLKDLAHVILSLLPSVSEGLGGQANSTELRLVAAVWRHGSRAPIRNVFGVSDEQVAAHWPRGLRELTTKGIQEQRLLGEFLHERYKQFMTDYSSETIYVRSSDSNRTIMSALATMSGFIPSTPHSVHEDLLLVYQKIPIHKTMLKYDRTLDVAYANCPPPYRPFIMKASNTSAERLASASDPKMLELLENGIGRKPQGLEVGLFTEAVICYHYDGKASLLPAWAQSLELYENMKKSYIKTLLALQGDPEYRRLRGLYNNRLLYFTANLFKEIADRFMKKVTEGEANKLQFIGYSTHDMTLLALLADWGVLEPSIFPEFSSCIMVELYERASIHYIEIWYRRGHGKELVQLKVKDCKEPCKLQEFVAIAEKYASVNITADCEKFKELGLEFVDHKYT